jgi:2,3-diaminopropionate biosynthesis protein SbnA
VTVISVPQAFNEESLYVDLRSIFGHPLFLKCEGFNFAGSIKLKAASEMVEAAERAGALRPDSVLVESSSGNLGVALSMIAASKGYRFLCVTDSRCNLSTRLLMEALGSQVHVIAEPDPVSGFLGARIDYVRALCAADGRHIWLNQYTNPGNWKSHYRTTAPAIARAFPDLDVLFVGAGTTGTLMGCARYFRAWHPAVRVVAVDSVGSVIFGGEPGRRMIPGLGTSIRPPLLDESYVDDVVHVEEADTIRACHRLARRGFLFGGSTGTVVSGAVSWLAGHEPEGLTSVAIAPDLGERYLDTIYHTNWLHDLYGEDVLKPAELAAGSPSPGGPPPAREPLRLEVRGRVMAYPTSDAGGSAVAEPAEAISAHLAEPAKTREPATGTESILAEMLADVVRSERVPVDDHFFDDLGADSLVMAHFCARVRKRGDLPSVSMRDIYRHPTIRTLATALEDAAPAAGPPVPGTAEKAGAAEAAEAPAVTSTRDYLLCGTLQLLFFVGYIYVAALVAGRAYEWIAEGHTAVDTYLRAVVFGGGGFLVLCVLPVLVKWVLIGRWKAREIPVWSLAYVRFWVVKTLVRSNPMALLFAGSPLFNLYLRALGAKVGRGAVIFSRHVPVCTDLLTVGERTVIRKESFFLCYRAHAGRIQSGAITIGRDAFVGERTVLDINTSLGDRAQLGHTSALHGGQAVPDGERWHGSPGQPTEQDYLTVAPASCGAARRAGFCAVTLLSLFFVYLPLVESGVYLLVTSMPWLSSVLDPTEDAITSQGLYVGALVSSLLVFFGGLLATLLFILSVPRLLYLFLKPGRVYPLYGFHDRLHRIIARMTGLRFFTYLFGDSSYIVNYLRGLGYDLSEVEQTGSNFGTNVLHENPYLSSVGTGTMVADGLSIVNADFSSTSFRLRRVSIGPHNFLGNNIAYPAGGRTGDNCLLATKVMVPLDGDIREGVGLLGSPSFKIPRSVERDSRFDHLRTGDELRRRLAAKNRYNIRTMGVFLFFRWLHVFLFTLLGLVAFDSYTGFGHLAMAAFFALSVLISPFYFALVERGIRAFRPLQPKYCSIYDPYFWRHERLWKVPALEYLHIFDGTPFRNVVWRLLGVRLGRRVFDDGCFLTERTLAAIGDDCVLNAGSVVQCHSQEDGTFKSDRTAISAGCTLGVGAFVHYGVTIGDGAVLAPDSFLMKGEEVPQGARWGGNPAREIRSDRYQLA